MKTKSDPNLEIRNAQFNLFKRQFLFLYVGVVVNSIFISSIYWDTATFWLVLAGPIFFSVISVFRIWHWQVSLSRQNSRIESSLEIADNPLVAGLVSLLMAAWVAALHFLSDGQSLVIASVFVFFTAFGSAFCLAFMPGIAVTVLLVPGAALSALLVHEGGRLSLLTAMIFISVSFLFWRLISQYYDFLIDLVRSRALVRAQRLEAEFAREEATRLAYLDQLTGLPNRLKYREEIFHRISSAPDQKFLIGMLDLDGFKPVNDVFGHAAGDRLLREVGRRLKAGLDEDAMVARLGGDEFGIIVSSEVSAAEICAIGNQLIQSLQQPVNIGEYVARISGSMGFAAYPEAGAQPDRLIESADYALYHSKKTKRGRTVTFDPDLESEIRSRATLEQSLRAAVTENQFEVFYQPIINCKTGETLSYEALARWKNEKQEYVSPQKFIRIAEETGLANQLCDILLAQALVDSSTWPQNISLSFNISAVQFSDADLGPRILSILQSTGFDPQRLEIEITESALMKSPDLTLHTIDILQSAGVRVALDDFGSGYASFAMIDQYPFNKLKIDQTITVGIEDSARKQHILKTIVDMCAGLEMRCVAEGVETPHMFRLIRQLGCDCVQGFLFAKPLSNEQLVHRAFRLDDFDPGTKSSHCVAA